MLRTAPAAARRTAASGSATCPAASGSMRAASRLRTSGLNRSDKVFTARRRAAGSPPSSAARARPVSISCLTAGSVSVAARWPSSSIVVASSERTMSLTARRRTAGSSFASANRATVIRRYRRSRLFVPILVSSASGAVPASASVSGSTSGTDGAPSPLDVPITTCWSWFLTNSRSSNSAVSTAPALEWPVAIRRSAIASLSRNPASRSSATSARNASSGDCAERAHGEDEQRRAAVAEAAAARRAFPRSHRILHLTCSSGPSTPSSSCCSSRTSA